jgi:hypothetical protein
MQFRFKGRIPDDDTMHQVYPFRAEGLGPAPGCVSVPGVGCVQQYAPTVRGANAGYDPAGDCDGFFTSYKYQVHNNCYNYAVDIATNTFAHPGRLHGLAYNGDLDGDMVVGGAQKDGLILIAGSEATLEDVWNKTPEFCDSPNGHLVALLIGAPDHSIKFHGDFHWVRCDEFESSSWSQKDGPDQITTLDFAGYPISDPHRANWTDNAGPFYTTTPGAPDFIISYKFWAWMFVPHRGVDII